MSDLVGHIGYISRLNDRITTLEENLYTIELQLKSAFKVVAAARVITDCGPYPVINNNMQNLLIAVQEDREINDDLYREA